MLTLIDSAEQFAQRISTFSHAEKRKTVLVPSMVHFDHFDRLAQVPSAQTKERGPWATTKFTTHAKDSLVYDEYPLV